MFKYYSLYVFLWYILYKLDIIIFNPIIIFYFILCFVVWMLLYMIYLKLSIKKIILFIIINLFIKVIPIYTLPHCLNIYDLLFGIITFIVYYIFIFHFTHKEPIRLYLDFINEYKELSI